MNRIDTKIVLGSLRYKSSIDRDSLIPFSLQSTQKEMDEFDRSTVLSLADIYNQEREESSIFRLTANIDFLFFNAYWGTSPYDKFTNQMYYVDSEESYVTKIWSGYPQYNEFDLIRTDNNTPSYTTAPNPHVDFKNIDSVNYNWSFYVSYPYKNDGNKRLQYHAPTSGSITWTANEGIPFYVQGLFATNGQSLISLVCGVKHNINSGEFVEITIAGQKYYEQVISLGNEGYNSDKYILNLYINNFSVLPNNFPTSVTGVLKRIVDINTSGESMSKYYVRTHRIITNHDEANLNKSAFQNNSFGPQRKFEFSTLTPDRIERIVQKHGSQAYNLTFKNDIDVSKYRDNLNRPISELYITMVHRGFFGWFNKPTLNGVSVKEGFEFNLSNIVSPYWDNTNNLINISNIKTNSYIKGPFTFYYNEFLKIDDVINGDFCEFNQYEQQEYVLSELYHKLTNNPDVFQIPENTNNTNPVGYYYKPHHKMTLRVYSNYIEEADIDDIEGAPDYSYYSPSRGVLIWRDLYTYGFIDNDGRGIEYPFLNGVHYPFGKIIFRLKPEGNVRDNIITIAQPTIDECE